VSPRQNQEISHALHRYSGAGARWRLCRQRAGVARLCQPGDSREKALANIREAIELYVEDCREAGDPVPTEVGKEFVEVEAA